MRYELEVIRQFSSELGMSCIVAEEQAELQLGDGVVLCFRNNKDEQGCLIGFKGTPWHAHDNITFEDGLGNSAEIDYLDVISGLKDGTVFVCERWIDGEAMDRWLIHRDFNDMKSELKFMPEGEELRVFRARSAKV